MRAVWLLAGALAMAAAGEATAATQFDLACTGSKAVALSGEAPAETRWETHIRVDLQVGEYCQDACPGPRLMVTARPNIIVFEDREDAASKDFTAVSRETGEFYSAHLSKPSQDGWTIRGACDPAPFSGIPILTR